MAFRFKTVAAVLAAVATVLPCAAAQAHNDGTGRSWFEPGIESPLVAAAKLAGRSYLANACHVGLSIAAQVDGRTAFFAFGSARRDRVVPLTPDSVYELASVTKTFTGALAAKALVDGRMSLDGDFRKTLPGSWPNLAYEGHPITLRSLATHSSGLQRDLPDSDALMARHDYDHIGAQLAVLDHGFTRERDLAALHAVSLRSAPGERFVYSNLGIRVIGYGLEGAYRQPFARLLDTAILGPLGMRETGFLLTPAMRARRATPYSRFGHPQPYHDAASGAAWGLWSTPRDMARYLAWQLDERDPVVATAHRLIRGTAGDGQGLIWNITEDGGERMLWHGGGSFGETSQMVLYPEAGVGFVLLANDACEGSEGALKTIAGTLRKALNPSTMPR